jgi:hypothetical protein
MPLFFRSCYPTLDGMTLERGVAPGVGGSTGRSFPVPRVLQVDRSSPSRCRRLCLGVPDLPRDRESAVSSQRHRAFPNPVLLRVVRARLVYAAATARDGAAPDRYLLQHVPGVGAWQDKCSTPVERTGRIHNLPLRQRPDLRRTSTNRHKGPARRQYKKKRRRKKRTPFDSPPRAARVVVAPRGYLAVLAEPMPE